MASDSRIRYCVNGHTVRDPDATACLVCHVNLDRPSLVTAPPLSGPEQASSTLWLLLILGASLVVLGLLMFVGLAEPGASDGAPAAGSLAGLAIAAVGQAMAFIGCVGIGVKLGVKASRADSPTV